MTAPVALTVSGLGACRIYRHGVVDVVSSRPRMNDSADGHILQPGCAASWRTHRQTKDLSPHIALRHFKARSETHQNFNIWVHGETDKLVRGSGLFDGEIGVSANRHFLAPQDGGHFQWLTGHYRLTFNWAPDSSHYLRRVDRRLRVTGPHQPFEALGRILPSSGTPSAAAEVKR